MESVRLCGIDLQFDIHIYVNFYVQSTARQTI
jgi:hypothetical protein